jgi:hypothetical protein
MTKKNFYSVIGLIFIALIIGCSKSDEKKDTKLQAENNFETITLKEENLLLRYNFSKGDKFKYKLTTISTSDETIKADSTINSKLIQTLTYFVDIEVLEIDEDNVAEMHLNIAAINLDANINGQKITFDSKAELPQEEKLRFIEYASIANSPYRARVSSRGEVVEVTRLDKMIDKMNSMQPQPQKLTAEQKSQLAKNLSESALRPLTQLLFRELPENPVGKDSTWEKKYPAQVSVFNIENTAVFKINDFIKIGSDKGALISADLTAKWSGNKTGEEEGVKYSFEDPLISGNGKIIFNIDKGLLVKGETLTNIELTVDVKEKDSLQKIKAMKRTEKSSNKNIVELLQ